MPKCGPKPKDKAPPHVGVPDPPPGLSAAAKKHWNRLTTEMAEAKVISPLDRDSLSLYISLWDRREEAERELSRKPKPGENPYEFGPVIRGPNGCPMMNPWFKISSSLSREMRPYLSMFGLCASARAKLNQPDPEEPVDPKWAELD